RLTGKVLPTAHSTSSDVMAGRMSPDAGLGHRGVGRRRQVLRGGVNICQLLRGDCMGAVENANHSAEPRWWCSALDDLTVVLAQSGTARPETACRATARHPRRGTALPR